MSANVNNSLSIEYQTEQSRLNILGFWIFLGAEIILFSTLFATFGVLKGSTMGGPSPKELFEINGVMAETLILLTSSFTCGLAVYEMHRKNKKGLLAWFGVTLLLGASFVGLEVTEFIKYVHEGATLQTNAFYSAFFTLLGTHGMHVSLGIGWGIMVMLQIAKRGIDSVTARKTFIIGLYWHFLDVIWIFIFTFVYLGRMV
ncbi:cytochrome aa3 quinol oxidase subunit III [Neobacillus sp. PS3-12]|jgi:cytochrome aa3-600 menaquinol oxidase subunit III|uniref:cytochrome aa3 quinol oxidase subunit III n=1 Tax=Neobacillus sp. PS3-12 TaxID=3070677 RepID=UPI0027E11EBF|nr:cytochrome aa3 quinol oxidase subunit III [Neobacillus sp. PS3-12]WML52819.1 cytochrome aa3 quinol oxidase subunit III [Neobacillus sp. PS3-12]